MNRYGINVNGVRYSVDASCVDVAVQRAVRFFMEQYMSRRATPHRLDVHLELPVIMGVRP